MDRTQELEEQVRRLTQTVEDMRGRMTRLESEPNKDAGSSGSDRRGFLRLGAGAVLGALGWAAVRAVPAAAATSGNMILGASNVAENVTSLAGDSGNPIPILSVAAQGTDWVDGTTGTFFGPLQGLAQPSTLVTEFEGVDGWASGAKAFGVYGLTDSGTGVVGEADTGIGLYARRSGRLRQDGLALAGSPVYSPNLYEQVRDADGVLWIHNATGVWRRVNTVRVDSADGSGAPFAPFRVFDSRTGAKPLVNSTTFVPIAGQGSGASTIPADAIAVMGNLTATEYTGGGFLALSPGGVSVGTSSVNFITGQTAIANGFIVGLGIGGNAGKVQVKVVGHASHFLIDITAYIQ